MCHDKPPFRGLFARKTSRLNVSRLWGGLRWAFLITCWDCADRKPALVSNLRTVSKANTWTGSYETLLPHFQPDAASLSLSHRERLSQAWRVVDTEAVKSAEAGGVLNQSLFVQRRLFCAAFSIKCRKKKTNAHSVCRRIVLVWERESQVLCWSILAEAIMKHWVFPGSQKDVLLGNIPRDGGWRTGLMRIKSSRVLSASHENNLKVLQAFCPTSRLLVWTG